MDAATVASAMAATAAAGAKAGAIVPHQPWHFAHAGQASTLIAAGSEPSAAEHILNVKLTYNNRHKMLRHGANTRVGQLMELHASLRGKPLVIVDAQGFEVGNELTLGTLVRPGSDLLELKVQADDW